MSLTFPKRIFITGTDTGIGKTLVSAILMTGLNGVYWKPVQSGIEPTTDTRWIKEKTGMADDRFHPEAYLLNTPVSPHLAAEIDNVSIELDKIIVPKVADNDTLIMEGAGGVMVPLNSESFVIDIIKKTEAAAIVVAPGKLGMINHTLLTIEKLQNSNVPVFGVVINGEQNKEHKKAVEFYGQVPVIAEIPHLEKINSTELNKAFKLFS